MLCQNDIKEVDVTRFLAKVRKEEKCWIWTACLYSKKTGYGGFKVKGKTYNAHVISYLIHKGNIPDGLYVLHHCDNRICVNPECLFLGTHSDNMKDAASKGRINTQINSEKIRGENHGSIVLDNQKVKEIISLYQETKNMAEVARIMKLKWSTVRDVIRGITWTHITKNL